MRPVVAFGCAGAGENVSVDADGDVGLRINDGDCENVGTGSFGVSPPEGEIPPRDDTLCSCPRSTGMPMLKFREAV